MSVYRIETNKGMLYYILANSVEQALKKGKVIVSEHSVIASISFHLTIADTSVAID